MRNRIITALFIAVAVFAAGAGDINQRPLWPSSVYGSMLVDAITPFEVTGGLVGWWQLDDGSGSTAADASGDGNNGTLINMEEGDWDTGWDGAGYSLAFGGTDEYIELGSDASFIGDTAGTITAWVKGGALSTSEIRTIFGYGGGAATTAGLFNFRWSDGAGEERLQLVVRGDDGTPAINNIYVVTPGLDDGEWHHVAVVSTGAAYLMYVDGISESFTIGNGSNNGNWMGDLDVTEPDKSRIAVQRYNGIDANYMVGSLDDIRIYSRALSADEVAAIAAGN